MLQNYLKITLRNLAKQKLYAGINILGLAIGIAFCAFIFLYVQDELTFDAFHEHADRIYRVNQVEYLPGGGVASEMPWQPYPLAAALEADLPEVAHAVRMMEMTTLLRHGDRTFEETVLFADPALLEMFSFPLAQGDAATALQDLDRVVLSAAAARKYFGDDDAVGRTLDVRFADTAEQATFHPAVVAGVVADVPGNTSIPFDVLMPFGKLPATLDWIRAREDRWNASSFYTYVLLREGAEAAAVAAKLPAFRAKHQPDEEAGLRERGRWDGAGPPRGYTLQPLRAIHLDPSVMSGLVPPSDPRYAYILAAIALAILLIGCINFTTLAIGRSSSRAREIGVRKAVGAQRRQLMAQFWGEAVLLSVIALVVGIALAELGLPLFNTLAAKTLRFDYLGNLATVLALVGLVLATGLLAGVYPALVLSRVRPIEVLRQRLRLGGANALTRSLVVVQFALSVALVLGALIMMRQLDYLQQKDLGFASEQVVVIPTQGLDGTQVLQRLRQELGATSGVRQLTAASSAFTHGYSREGWDDAEGIQRSAYTYRVESNFIDVMGMELAAGRAFDPRLATDSTEAVLVNEALVAAFGWEEPLGQVLTGFYDEPTVVGVVRDVHFRSLHETVEPMVLNMSPDWGVRHLLARTEAARQADALAALETAWEKVAPEVPFAYSFLEEDLAKQYAGEQRWSRIVGYGAGFAILVACLGLFGLAALTVAGRTKELGIRKVLGLSAPGVALLVSRDFLRLVLVGFLLATPAAWWAMAQWLETFAYRITPGPLLFLGAGVLVAGVALLAVSYQALKGALANPVKSLRYE